MSKLSSMAKGFARQFNNLENPDETITLSYKTGFMVGFETAFKTIKDELQITIEKAEQYPMMGERIFALKTYIAKMDKLLEEMKKND